MEHLYYIPESMMWPLAACLVLTGIHVYLGVHVIARKVIFVDLALAQIAALGTVVGVLLGYEVGKDSTALYFYSLAFTIFGAFVFSITKMKGEKVPHEAIIGIVYAVTFAATILVLSRSALGPQELDHILKGELLWVQSATVMKTAIIYALVGLFHFLFRKQFMAISFDPIKAEQDGINVRLWDFLFYMSFGFVITSSVAIAGVFLVFSYLVIPAVGAMLLSEKLSTRLMIGWIGGAVISFLGIKLSWDTGLPTSPLIVCLLATALLISGMIRYVRLAARPIVAVRNLLIFAMIAALFVSGIFFFRKPVEDPLDHTLHMLESKLSTDRQTALANLSDFADQRDQWMGKVLERLRDEDAEVRRAAVELLVKTGDRGRLAEILPLARDPSYTVRKSVLHAVLLLGESRDGELLVQVAEHEEDPEMKVAMLSTALNVGAAGALLPLVDIAREDGLFADEAYHALHDRVEFTFTKSTLDKLVQWWKTNQHRLIWDKATKRFIVQRGTEKHG